jgi:hypothetical protein
VDISVIPMPNKYQAPFWEDDDDESSPSCEAKVSKVPASTTPMARIILTSNGPSWASWAPTAVKMVLAPLWRRGLREEIEIDRVENSDTNPNKNYSREWQVNHSPVEEDDGKEVQ